MKRFLARVFLSLVVGIPLLVALALTVLKLSGGEGRYCLVVPLGHRVFMLYPGHFSFITNSPSIIGLTIIGDVKAPVTAQWLPGNPNWGASSRLPLWQRFDVELSTTNLWLPRDSDGRVLSGKEDPDFHATLREKPVQSISLFFPYWGALGLLLLPLFVWILCRLYSWRRWLAATGTCAKCGYDLRATPDRCPECGTVANAKTQNSAPPRRLLN